MSLGIDPGTVLRFAKRDLSEFCYCTQGAPPCRLHEYDYIWSRSRMARQTSREGVIVFEQAWAGLYGLKGGYGPSEKEGTQQSHSWDRIISEALRQLAPEHSGKVALAVDNSLSEDLQETLLRVCARAHFSNVDLLWRPVAILLDYLDRNPECWLTEQSSVLVVDAESTQPEATLLELRKTKEMLVPLRCFFQKAQHALEPVWTTGDARIALAEELVKGKSISKDELIQGAFSEVFYRYRDGENVSSTWVKSGTGYEPLKFEKKLDQILAGNRSLDRLINSVLTSPSANKADMILWHGWPFRSRKPIVNNTNAVMPDDSVARGCRVYADRVERGLPTYLEKMPGLAIMSKNPTTNRDEYFPIIKEGEYLGGQIIYVDPINRFSLDSHVTALKIILQRDDWIYPKQVEFIGIPPLEEPAPITISGEMKPGQGKLKLWLTSRNDEKDDLFGDRRRIEINWDTMKDYIQPQQSPEVYPAYGLINSTNLAHIKSELARFIRDPNATLNTPLKIPEYPRQFEKILNPTGRQYPGLFGTIRVNDIEMDELADRVGKKISQLLNNKINDRFRYLNYMYIFTLPTFVQELRDIYSHNGLPSTVKWNGAFAPGRVFSTPEDLSLFMNYLIKISGEHSWPQTPNKTYTDKYFWSVFRCLCYHERAADIDSGLADQVCRRICNYIEYRNRNNWDKIWKEKRSDIENTQKFCLCALLFLTRVRRYRHPIFLRSGNKLTDRVLDLIQAMPQVNFKAMKFINLNQLVLNFIRNEAGDEDYKAVSGLVTEMA